MTPSNRRTILQLGKIGHLALLVICLGAAYSVTARSVPWGQLASLRTERPFQVFFFTAALALAWHMSLNMAGIYRSYRFSSVRTEVADIISGCLRATVSTLGWLLALYGRSERSSTKCLVVTVCFGLLSTGSFLSWHLVHRLMARKLRRSGYNLRHVIVLGTNPRATRFAAQLREHPEWGYHIHGFVDEFWWDETTREANEGKLLGDFSALPYLLRTMAVDELVVALPIASFYHQVATTVLLCKEHGILARSTGAFFEMDEPEPAFPEHSAGMITLHDASWNAWSSLMKRIVDVGLSLILLIIVSPVMLIVALLIKLTSPGPVLFTQVRLGLGKRPFKIFKCRTMVADAEQRMKAVEHLNQTDGPTFKLQNDPRITKIGSFLRKTSLDELPQLLNVLRGDMSLVGPRPLPLRDYEGFSLDWHRRRFSVKPGITCLWQVTGRSSITFDEWMALDIQYIDQWSVWLDIKILLQTIPAVFRGSGAM